MALRREKQDCDLPQQFLDEQRTNTEVGQADEADGHIGRMKEWPQSMSSTDGHVALLSLRRAVEEYYQQVNLYFISLNKPCDSLGRHMDKFFEMIDEHVSGIANKDSLKLVAKTVALGANKSHVGSPVNTIVLKDRKVRAVLRKPQLRTKFKRVHNKFQKIKKNKCDILKDDKFYNIVQSKPLGGHAIPARGRSKEKQHCKWQISLPHPPCSKKNRARVTTDTIQDGGGDHVNKTNPARVGMNQQNPPCKLSPKTPPSEKGGKFKQTRHGVATPMLDGNKSSMIFGQGGKLNARKIPITRENSKDTKWLCDKCKNQNNHMTVDEARKPQTQQRRECVQMTKQDQSGQAMPHGRFGRTKTLKNSDVPPRVKNTGDFLCHGPVAKMKQNRTRGISNKGARAGQTGKLQASYDCKKSKPMCVELAGTSESIHGWLVWFDPWSWQWVWTFGMMVYAKV
ncbi:unnamed protein product [Linum trigynum]|uniref:Uncharacterized protein n=1 Tax=Linum trigynum TaxID=586398 RepID=A0AAV2CID1_9ROSI